MIPWTPTYAIGRTIWKLSFLPPASRLWSNIGLKVALLRRLRNDIRQRMWGSQRTKNGRTRRRCSQFRRSQPQNGLVSRLHLDIFAFHTLIRFAFFTIRWRRLLDLLWMTPQPLQRRRMGNRFLTRLSVPWLLCRLFLILCASGHGRRRGLGG